MLLDFDKAVTVFRKVEQVHEEIRGYCLASDRPALPIEELKRVVGQMYGLAITIEEVPYELTYVRGMLLRYQTRSLIYIGKDQSTDWKRFTAAKELCHLISDVEEDWSSRGADTLVGLLVEMAFDNDELARNVEQSEVFAELAALELLYPIKERLEDIETLAAGEISYTKIANFYQIPEPMVRQALEPVRLDAAKSVWEGVQAEKGSPA